jgi:hypothetical protein
MREVTVESYMDYLKSYAKACWKGLSVKEKIKYKVNSSSSDF